MRVVAGSLRSGRRRRCYLHNPLLIRRLWGASSQNHGTDTVIGHHRDSIEAFQSSILLD